MVLNCYIASPYLHVIHIILQFGSGPPPARYIYIFVCHCGLVDYCLCLAFSLQWAGIFRAAIAISFSAARKMPAHCKLGECQTKAVIYQAAVTNKATKEVQTYVGLTENTFKTRYLNHTSSFRTKTKRNATELSKHIWKLKDSNTSYSINWKIIKKSQPYSNKTKRCNLCMSEKFIIICHPELSSLNKRNELISTCRHLWGAICKKIIYVENVDFFIIYLNNSLFTKNALLFVK